MNKTKEMELLYPKFWNSELGILAIIVLNGRIELLSVIAIKECIQVLSLFGLNFKPHISINHNVTFLKLVK